MIKTLRYSLLSLLVLVCGSAFAQEVKFDWSGETTTQTPTEDNVFTDEAGLVTLTFSKGAGSNIPAINKEGAIRMYKNTNLNIKAKDGYNIVSVAFTPTGSSYSASNLTYEGTAISDEWTLSSPVNEALLTASANARFKTIVVTVAVAGADIISKPTISAEDNFLGNTEVTIEAAEGCDIYYTTDGSEPTSSSTKYTEAFTIWETTTVKAIAVKDDKTSDIAEKTFNLVPLEGTTIGYLNEKTEDQAWVHLKLEGAVVTYVDGKNIYLRDIENGKALMLYGIDFSAHEAYPIEVGDLLGGSIICDYDNYYGIHEVKTNKFTDVSEIFVIEGTAPNPTKVSLTDILALNNICDYVLVQGTIASEISGTKTNYFVVDEGGNKVQLYKGLDVSGFADDGKTYYITAVFNAIYSGAAELQPITVTKNDPTAISNVNAETTSDNAIYNLAGQQRSKLAKGINIVNGKKVVK